jgi:ATP-dependent helicase HepA
VEEHREVSLERGERVWIAPAPGETRWLTGRLAAERHAEKLLYYVDLPNQETRAFAEERVWTRWDRPIDDPMAMVVKRIGESPYLFENRLRALKAVSEQHSRIAGLKGLWSSVVELHEHQVEAARRILMDPVQRYLLADEVGLGKTVEAGIVIRETLSQNPEARVLVLVPDHLVTQWQGELESKFHPEDFGRSRVNVAPHSSLSEQTGNYALCVIDEVHRLVTHPFHATPSQLAVFGHVRRLALESPGLLLLTATPVRAGDVDYLAILHLLSPDTHPLDGLEEFREKLKNRNTIAEMLLGFTPDMAPAFIPLVTQGLAQLIPNDTDLQELLEHVNQSVEQGEDPAGPIQDIRDRIANKYRLHNRMIRNRRVGEVLHQFPVRGRETEPGLWMDIATTESQEALHEVRDSMQGTTDTPASRAQTMSACLHLVSTGTWAAESEREFCVEQVGRELVERLEAASLKDGTLERRTEQITHFIRQMRTPGGGTDTRKKVVFATSAVFADSLDRALRDGWGDQRVFRLTNSTSHSVISEFRAAHGQVFLVCDRSVEEGVNLQFAEVVVLADLPFSTRQLEQRIGRFDRFSSEFDPVRLIPMSNETDSDRIWVNHLQSCGIFEGSVAGLQYALADLEEKLFDLWARDGSDPARDLVATTRDFVDTELRELAKQDILDAAEFSDRSDDSYFSALKSESRASPEFENAVKRYAQDLGLRFSTSDNGAISLGSRFRSTHLINPRRAEQFRPEEWRHLGSFHRDVAVDIPSCRLLGLGNPLVDAIADSLQTDDKGRVAIRRLIVNSLSHDVAIPFFDVHFLVRAELTSRSKASTVDTARVGALKSMVDRAFPALVRTCIRDSRLENPPADIIEKIMAPYSASPADINLCGSGYETLMKLTGSSTWERLCRDVEVSARATVLDSELRGLIDERCSAVRSSLDATRKHLQSRVDAGMDLRRVLDEHDDIAAELLEAVSNPLITLDCVRVTFLTGPDPR